MKRKVKTESLSPYLTEREQQIDDDHEWCWRDGAVQEQYGGQVVVVHRQRIWGAGKNHAAAWAAAGRREGCPAKECVAFVVVPYPWRITRSR